MNTKFFIRNIKAAALALSLIFGFILLSGTTANAQWRDNDRNDRRNDRRDDDWNRGNGGFNPAYRIAMENGARDGLSLGTRDARRHDRFDPQNTREYKQATSGYSSRFGSKEAYKQAYREGFMRAYRQAYEDERRRSGGGRGNGGWNNGRNW